jgi:hypothetical protein
LSLAGYVVVASGVLLRVDHKQAASDILDVERSEARRDVFGVVIRVAVVIPIVARRKGAMGQSYGLEVCVIHFNTSGTEIRNVQVSLAFVFCSRGALIDRAIQRAFISAVPLKVE